MADDGKEITVFCTCCEARLTVDVATASVVAMRRPKRPSKSFDDMVVRERQRRDEAEERFQQALSSQSRQQELLDRRFDKALEEARKDPESGRPLNPLDLD